MLSQRRVSAVLLLPALVTTTLACWGFRGFGDIAGTGQAAMLQVLSADGSASFVALER